MQTEHIEASAELETRAHDSHRWFRTAMFFFLFAAALGTLMRYLYLREIPMIDYRHVLHAHSHVAQLGWAFMLTSGSMLFLLIRQLGSSKAYSRIFWLNVVATIGMAIAFLIQGYEAFSIAFSALHIVAAYLFAYYFLRDLREKKGLAYRFTRWSVYWMLISTIGIWALPIISMTLGKMSPVYYMAVQFFLHFQFNGWFTYAIIGLWLHYLSEKGKHVQVSNTAFWLLQLSLLLTYALSITWSTPVSLLFYLNSLGVILQAVALYMILKRIFSVLNPFFGWEHWTDGLFALGIVCLIGKVVAQLAVSIPAVAEISYTIRNYVVGFIHLIMLGSITFTLVALLLKESIMPVNNVARAGWMLFAAGFLLKEVALFGQGTLLWMKRGFLPYYHEILLGCTAILPIALIVVLSGYSFQRNHYQIKHI